MTDYKAVQDALAKGTDPAMLCDTCPWDRNCITPPQMTAADVEARVKEAVEQDQANETRARMEGREAGLPMGSLLTAIVYAGKDTSATVCPVFSLRLRSSAGRALADSIRSSMQGWDDQS